MTDLVEPRTVNGAKIRFVCAGYAVLTHGTEERSRREHGDWYVALIHGVQAFFIASTGVRFTLTATGRATAVKILTEDGEVVSDEPLAQPMRKRDQMTFDTSRDYQDIA